MSTRTGILFILGLAIAFVGCGGEIPGGPGAREDGRIFLRNETEIPMHVTYTDEDLGQVDIVVEGGQEKDISQVLLEGGTEVVVKVEALGSPRPRAEIPLTVDGDAIIDIISFGQFGSDELEYRLLWRRRGGRGSPAGTRGVLHDGRIFVWNETEVVLDVSYLNEKSELIKTVVEPNAREDVSQGVLKGGTEVTVKIVARATGSPRADIKLTIDDNKTIRVFRIWTRQERRLEYELR